MKRVVITGIGLASCLGHSLEEVTHSLRAGISGIHTDPERVERGFRCPHTGRVPPFDIRGVLNRKERRFMGQPATWGALAALRALDDAGLTRDRLRADDVGVIIGNDSTANAIERTTSQVRADGGTHTLGAAPIIKSMTSTASMNLSTWLGTRGAAWSIGAACASGAHAIGQAWSLIASGLQEIVLAGGVQEIGWPAMCAFDGLGAFSGSETPEAASRPFDRGRDGLVPSGGGAILILESEESARRRGARIRAEVAGYAFSSDGHHITRPSGEGARRCLRQALQRARLGVDEVDLVSAHATSTVEGDAAEAEALKAVFGDHRPRITATKSLTGHECWMAGASEVVYGLLMMEHSFVAGTRNFAGGDERTSGLRLSAASQEARIDTLVSNSFGFGGTNAVLVLRRG